MEFKKMLRKAVVKCLQQESNFQVMQRFIMLLILSKEYKSWWTFWKKSVEIIFLSLFCQVLESKPREKIVYKFFWKELCFSWFKKKKKNLCGSKKNVTAILFMQNCANIPKYIWHKMPWNMPTVFSSF